MEILSFLLNRQALPETFNFVGLTPKETFLSPVYLPSHSIPCFLWLPCRAARPHNIYGWGLDATVKKGDKKTVDLLFSKDLLGGCKMDEIAHWYLF